MQIAKNQVRNRQTITEELADDSQEGRERRKGKVDVLQREKEI